MKRPGQSPGYSTIVICVTKLKALLSKKNKIKLKKIESKAVNCQNSEENQSAYQLYCHSMRACSNIKNKHMCCQRQCIEMRFKKIFSFYSNYKDDLHVLCTRSEYVIYQKKYTYNGLLI